MGKAADIARRSFLLGSAAVAGGVAFGAYLYNKPAGNPLLKGLARDGASFNAWVKIDGDGITLIAPHTDMGQGVRSLQAMLIAEEMDVEPGQFRVETGNPAAAYFNTAMGGEALPFAPEDQSFKANFARGAMETIAKTVPVQVTGGSTTAPDSYVKLREAGAIARETLKLTAARREGVPVADLTTDRGAVVMPGGKRIAYTDLAADAAGIEPVRDVTLRDPKDWKFIGKPTERLDIVGKSTGTAEYGIDLKREGMVYAGVQLNPHQGGALLSFDAAPAKEMEGVMHVFAITDGVAVIADNSWTAMKAAEAVECEWGEADFLPNQEQHWAALAAAFDGALDSESRNDGDVDDAIGDDPNGDGVVAGEYKAPYLAHAPLEPIGALIHVKGDRTELHVATQIPGFARDFVAEIVGQSPDNVHVFDQLCGGSFGHRLEFENIKAAAEIGAAMKRVPVKLTYSREQDMTHDFPRHICMSRFRAGVANGKVEALDIAVSGAPIMASQGSRSGLPDMGADMQLHAGISNAPYAIPNMRARAYIGKGLAPTSSWRSVGASANGFFIESALDEAIHAAGADPMAERLRLCNDLHSKAVLEAVAEMSNWGEELPANTGRGVAFVHSFGTPCAQVIEVTNGENGITIDKVWVAANVGPVLDPVNFDNLVKGGVVWGLGHAMNCEITYKDGSAEQNNYHAFQAMRMNQCPEIFVRAVDTGKHVTGIGEPPVPPAPPALANAIFAATGKRLREMPFNKGVDFAGGPGA